MSSAPRWPQTAEEMIAAQLALAASDPPPRAQNCDSGACGVVDVGQLHRRRCLSHGRAGLIFALAEDALKFRSASQ
jgi:hypothetical protein